MARNTTTNDSARRLNALAKQTGAQRYLEIGVARGETFRDIEIPYRTAVDPAFLFKTDKLASPSTRFVKKTSDDFFSTEPFHPTYDLVFIDGLHQFEQVLRDFSNSLLRMHPGSIMLIDDTLPNDVYSALPDFGRCMSFRKAAAIEDGSWHGDVFKIVFYIHDFWPGLSYRTITGSGNAQTLVWRAQSSRRPIIDNLERISRLTYFDLQEQMDVMQPTSEEDAIDLCVSEVRLASPEDSGRVEAGVVS
jgi:hypothetical protein